MATKSWLTVNLASDGVLDANIHVTEDVTTSDDAVHTVVHAQAVELPQEVIDGLTKALTDAFTPGLTRRLSLAKAQTLIAVERGIENKSRTKPADSIKADGDVDPAVTLKE